MNIVNKLPRGNVMWILLFAAWASCATVHKESTIKPGQFKVAEPMEALYISPSKAVSRRDTIPPKPSRAAMEAYMREQYKLNYDLYFAPQFNRMANSIASLQETNSRLAETNATILLNARTRIHGADSIASFYRDDALGVRKQMLADSKRQTEQYERYLVVSDQTVQTLNKQTEILVVLSILIIVAVALLYLYVRYWVSKVKEIQRQLAHE